MAVTLYRKVISGSAVEQGGEYGSREGGQSSGGVKGDETEDLYELLLEIKVCILFKRDAFDHFDI